MVNNNDSHTRHEPVFGLLAAVSGGACGTGLLFAGPQWFVVAPVLAAIVAAGIAVYLASGVMHARVSAVLGWAFGLAILTWPLIVFAVGVVVLSITGGDRA